MSASTGDIYGSDGSLIGRKDVSDRDFLAPLLCPEPDEQTSTTTNDLPEVQEVRVVHVEPGDVIWLRVDEADEANLTMAAAADIKARAQRIWPDNEVVVGANIDIAVVRPA